MKIEIKKQELVEDNVILTLTREDGKITKVAVPYANYCVSDEFWSNSGDNPRVTYLNFVTAYHYF